MGSREEILQAVRRAAPLLTPLPDLDGLGVRFADAAAQFAQSLRDVGGQCVRIPSASGLEEGLRALPSYASAVRVASKLPFVAKANVDVETLDDPHRLADVDFAVLPGEFGVAENGAVWVSERDLRHRAVYFITQHLALVVPAREIVNDMHEAYARLSFPRRGWSGFISGPSKTADIEQALVIGAHGPRSTTVFLVG